MYYGLPALFANPLFQAGLSVLILWTLIWKGFALWHAARNRQTTWYVILLILNTLGILEIIYLAFFRKDENNAITNPSAPKAE